MNENGGPVEDEENLDVGNEGNKVDIENLLQKSTQKLFDGSQVNRLQCTIVIFFLYTLYSIPNTFVDALLNWVASDLLPTSNCFPKTSYEMRSILMKWGLKHRQVHCCPNGHVLYEGENKNLSSCPTCNESRYILGSNNVPQ